MSDSTPEGFRPIVIAEGFIGHNGPYYWRRGNDGRFEFGFQSDARHGNPNGVLHGGAVLGFLDTILGHAVVVETKRRCATISLDARFVAAASPGSWLSGRAIIRKLTRGLAFVDGEAAVQNTLIVTATSIFRVFDG
jgi:acyl-coenzyme A thioesterase PaaI-like protein